MLQKLKGFFEKKEGEIVGIASTAAVDRQGESIKQDGWDLSQFKKNPVILASHKYHEFPIGKATDIGVKDGKLVFKFILSEVTREAKEAAALIKEGILNAFSVGFVPRERDKKNLDVITKAELLEVSVVSVPANPEAVVLAKSFDKNLVAKSLVKQWLTDSKIKEGVEEIEEKEKGMTKEGLEKHVKEYFDKFEKECPKLEDIHKTFSSEDAETSKETEKKENEVEPKSLDRKLLQKATGMLQEVCKELKEKGGAEK